MNKAFKLIHSETVPVTHDLVDEFNTMERSPTDRLSLDRRVDHLKEKFTAGLAVPFLWAKVKVDGKTYRMNGQHSSKALLGMEHFPEGLMAHIDTYEADDIEGAALLFRQFDDRKSSRSAGDVAGAYQGTKPGLRDVPRPYAKLGAEGVHYFLTHRRGATFAPLATDDQYTLMLDETYHPFMVWLGGLLSKKTPELKLAAVIGAMYATWLADGVDARDFWLQVSRKGDEAKEDQPYVLDTWLLDYVEQRDKRKKIKETHLYQGSVFAWNAFRDGTPIRDIKFDTIAKKGVLSAGEPEDLAPPVIEDEEEFPTDRDFARLLEDA